MKRSEVMNKIFHKGVDEKWKKVKKIYLERKNATEQALITFKMFIDTKQLNGTQIIKTVFKFWDPEVWKELQKLTISIYSLCLRKYIRIYTSQQ